jgi:hypothetical protein
LVKRSDPEGFFFFAIPRRGRKTNLRFETSLQPGNLNKNKESDDEKNPDSIGDDGGGLGGAG